jgi:hypothetical protein
MRGVVSLRLQNKKARNLAGLAGLIYPIGYIQLNFDHRHDLKMTIAPGLLFVKLFFIKLLDKIQRVQFAIRIYRRRSLAQYPQILSRYLSILLTHDRGVFVVSTRSHKISEREHKAYDRY